MKVNISVTGEESTIELIAETTSDRDALDLAVNANKEAKVRKNGSIKFIMKIPQVAIGRVAMNMDHESPGEEH